MSGKRYTEEFKIAAVKQVAERGHPASEVAVRLGMSILLSESRGRKPVAIVSRLMYDSHRNRPFSYGTIWLPMR